MQQIMSLLDSRTTTPYKVVYGQGISADNQMWYTNDGVPAVLLWSDDKDEFFFRDPTFKEKYFYYHHTAGKY